MGLKINELEVICSAHPENRVDGSSSALHDSESILTSARFEAMEDLNKSVAKTASDNSKNVSEIIRLHGLVHIHNSVCQTLPSFYARVAEIYHLLSKHHIDIPVHIPPHVLKSLEINDEEPHSGMQQCSFFLQYDRQRQ